MSKENGKRITYDAWVECRVKNDTEPMTRSQSLFAKAIFENEELVKLMAAPADLQTIFKNIQQWLKQ